MSTHRIRRLAAAAALAALLPAVAVLAATPAAAATGTALGARAAALATANVGHSACGPNSLGGQYFDTSCTGNSGQPENWGADFVAWAWAKEGASTTGLLTTAGGSTPALFAKYGGPNGSVHTSPLYTPQPGDAIVFDSPADYVAIVTAVNADGSIQTTNGDWGGEGPGATTVQNVTIPSGQTAAGSAPDPMNGKTITSYVSPATASGANTSLSPFGSITWTPPGSATARVDVFAADSAGALWDFSHPVGHPGLFGTPVQVESGWTHYREFGVADLNHDGYPDIVAIDTSNNLLDVFTGSTNGFATTPNTTLGSGWSTDFEPMGISDYDHTGHFGLLAIQRDTSTLWFYPGDLTGGKPTSGFRTQIATGWGANLTGVADVDVTGDGHADILTCNSASGTIWLYPGDATGGQAPASQITTCGPGTTIFGVADYNGDGHPDLITRDDATGVVSVTSGSLSDLGTVIATGTATTTALVPFGATTWTPPGTTTARTDIYAADPSGNLWDYPETPNAPLATAPILAATGWTHFRRVGVADFNHDGYPDVVAIDTSTSKLEVFTGSASGALSTTPATLPYTPAWSADYVPYGIADYNHDGHFDVIAQQVSTNQLWVYPGDLTGGGLSSGVHTQIGGGWTSMFTPVDVGTLTTSGNTDILACRTDTTGLALYPGNGTGNYQPMTLLANNCTGYTYFGLTDYTGDGHPDLIARDNSSGDVVVVPANGAGGWSNSASTDLATNW